MILLFNVLIIGSLIYLVNRYQRDSHNRLIFFSALSIKLLSGILVGSMYSYYYQHGDTFEFLDLTTTFNNTHSSVESYLTAQFFEDIPGLIDQPRTMFFIKIISPIVLLSGGNYWITSVYLSLFGFVCFWHLSKEIIRVYPHYRPIIYFAFLFLPSSVFWSSGLLKDTIINGLTAYLVGIILYYYFKNRNSLLKFLLALIAFIVLIKLKHYAAGLIIIFGGSLLLFGLVNQYKIKYGFILLTCLFIFGIYSIQFIHPWLSINRLPLTILENQSLYAQPSNAGNLIDYTGFEPTYLSIFLNTPKAIFSGFFRPMFWEANSIFSVFASIENAFLLFVTIISIIYFKLWKFNPLVISGLLFILTLCLFISISTPNFGSLARYKSLYLPYFLLLVAIIPYQRFFLHKY